MEHERNESGVQWDAFLHNIQKVCEKKLDLEPNLFPKENKNEILELLGEVLKQLQTDDIKTILENEKVELGIERNGNNIVGWLEKEIKLFNNSVNEDFSGRHNDLKLADIRISQGKTIKDSIGKLFNLPEWLKKILDVLNELLSLIKGAA